MPILSINDTELFYVETGAGEPCVVLHGGLGLDHTYLHPWLDPLGDRLRLLYPDLRGNGRSGRPPVHTLTFDQFVADLDALRAHLGLTTMGLLGHSYGGFIALHYAVRFPARVTRLMLLNTAPAWDYVAEVRANARRKGATPAMLDALDVRRVKDARELRRAFQRFGPLYYHRFDVQRADRLFRHTIFDASAARRSAEILKAYDLIASLGAITASTLIVTGRDDFITPPSQAERLRRGIPRAELIVFERSGHFPYIEEPEAFFPAVREWLDRAR